MLYQPKLRSDEKWDFVAGIYEMTPSDLRVAVRRILCSASWFWPVIILSVATKMVLVSDFSLQAVFSPHDDSLYISRAFNLLSGAAFGSYDSRTLVKFPGFSFWLAGVRTLGIPYLFSVNLLYIGAGAYFLLALLRCGFPRWLLAVSFLIYAFNPLTMGYEWIRATREPLSTVFLVVIFAAMLHVLIAIRQARSVIIHVNVLSVIFAFALLVREEDPLLYGAWFAFSATLIWQARLYAVTITTGRRLALIVIIVLPLVVASVANAATRLYIEKHYGLPILHEMGEGEFPRLMAALRSIDSKKDNRLVMVTQEALSQLLIEAPSFSPVITRLPKPGPQTYSCQRYGVCSEWANGWMPFWIKDAAFEAGVTPDLPSAQAYFREVRQEIERACNEGRLKCREKGSGLIPRFELRWTRAYLQEWVRFVRMSLVPDPYLLGQLPTPHNITPDYGRIFQAVTMTYFFEVSAQNMPDTKLKPHRYVNPLEEWRRPLANVYGFCWPIVEILALTMLGMRLLGSRSAPPGPFVCVVTVFLIYVVLRVFAMAYLAVYMGFFDSRLAYSVYSLALLIALPVIYDTLNAMRDRNTVVPRI